MRLSTSKFSFESFKSEEEARQLVADPEAEMFLERDHAIVEARRQKEETQEKRNKNKEAEAMRLRKSAGGEEIRNWLVAAETVKDAERAEDQQSSAAKESGECLLTLW